MEKARVWAWGCFGWLGIATDVSCQMNQWSWTKNPVEKSPIKITGRFGPEASRLPSWLRTVNKNYDEKLTSQWIQITCATNEAKKTIYFASDMRSKHKPKTHVWIVILCYRVYYKAIAKLTASSIKKQLPSMHKTHTGLSDAQAEIEYLKVRWSNLFSEKKEW